MLEALAFPADFKPVGVVDGEITLLGILDCVVNLQLGDKKALSEASDVLIAAKDIVKVDIVEVDFVRFVQEFFVSKVPADDGDEIGFLQIVEIGVKGVSTDASCLSEVVDVELHWDATAQQREELSQDGEFVVVDAVDSGDLTVEDDGDDLIQAEIVSLFPFDKKRIRPKRFVLRKIFQWLDGSLDVVGNVLMGGEEILECNGGDFDVAFDGDKLPQRQRFQSIKQNPSAQIYLGIFDFQCR